MINSARLKPEIKLKASVIMLASFLAMSSFNWPNCAAQAIVSHKRHRTTQTTTLHHRSTKKHTFESRHAISHKTKHRHVQARARYAYPMSLFLTAPPGYDSSSLSEGIAASVRKAFVEGTAGEYPTRSLVRSQIAYYYPLHGGIYWRREPIKYIILHSTEPGTVCGARTIIDGWNHGGRRHAGAHYVIERDGTIYQALDPDLAAVHVNIFKTLPGINNDNSVGIEMCHSGMQDYPPAQVQAAVRLTTYLQSHYHVSDNNIITHRYAQQGDHTDPVNFAWADFIDQKNTLQNQGLNYNLASLKTDFTNWQSSETPAIAKTIQQPVIKKVVEKPLDTPTKTIYTPSEPQPLSSIVSNNRSHLLPASQTTRLVPVSMVVHVQPEAQSENQSATPNSPPIINKSFKVLPLKGPIEMDPDVAASLLLKQ